MILSDYHIRSIIKEALKFRKPRGGSSGSNSYSDDGSSSGFEYKTGNTKIGSRVNWGPGEGGEKRKVAWAFLSQFLPDGSMLTSCYRSQSDQERIIKNYAEKNKYAGDKNDFNAMHAFIKSKGLVVARRIGKGHGGKQNTGAFDVSGADLDAIWEGVEAANNDPNKIAKFDKLKQGSIIERKNNAVHVQFRLRNVDLSKKDLLAKKEDSTSPEGSADKSSATSVQIVHKNTSIKDGIDNKVYPALKAVVKDGKNKGIYLQIKADKRTFKRTADGAPVFKGGEPTFTIVKDNDEVKELIASA
jgi:hypothetical protein